MARINYDTKQKLISLAGTCFWYWNSYYTFLGSCGVPKRLLDKYPRDSFNKYDVMRNILSDLEDQDNEDAINSIVSNFYRMKSAADNDVPDPRKAKELLREFRESVGNDPIEKELEKRKRDEHRKKYEENAESYRSARAKLQKLNTEFLSLHIAEDLTPQQRGFKLESLFCDLLELNELEYKRPFRTPTEQIDGHLKFEKFDYLLETKWEKGPIKQDSLSIFDGKIRGKAQSTRGLFIAANGFDQNAVAKFSGDSPRIILMTGEDLALAFGDRIDLKDGLKAKVDAIVRYGNIHLPFRDVGT